MHDFCLSFYQPEENYSITVQIGHRLWYNKVQALGPRCFFLNLYYFNGIWIHSCLVSCHSPHSTIFVHLLWVKTTLREVQWYLLLLGRNFNRGFEKRHYNMEPSIHLDILVLYVCASKCHDGTEVRSLDGILSDHIDYDNLHHL